ncbi:MAG: hypothetical protein NWE92_06715 [Candidatus Bathyarchaeota archaeon]|nr:hypothetical protein [Candidatus Bathyarchaeota archaeon]
MSKVWAMLLIALFAASNLLLAESVFAQSKPTVPEFTLKYVDDTHTEPPTYGTDPYTGNSIIVAAGRKIVNQTVLFTIKNQPYTSNGDSLYYHVRYKGHYEEHWSGNSQVVDGRTIIYDTLVFPASNTAYTEISVVKYSAGGSDWRPLNYVFLPDGGQMDFQIQAIVGSADIETPKTTWGELAPIYKVNGQIGDWSPTHTITIAENQPTTTPNTDSPTPSAPPESQSPSQSEPQSIIQFGLDWIQSAIFVMLCFVAVLLIVVVVLLYKGNKKQTANYAP